jgi:hypothetical protein
MEPLYALQKLGEFGSAMTGSRMDEDKQLLFVGTTAYPLDQLTPARRTAGARKGEPYTLRDIYVALLYTDASLREYVAYCQQNGVSRLMEAERKELVKFMLGEISVEESSLLGASVDSAGSTLRHAASALPPTTAPATGEDADQLPRGSAPARESPVPRESSAPPAIGGDKVKHERSDFNGEAPLASAADTTFLAQCREMERIQRTCDAFFELDKRKQINFLSFPVIEALRKSLIAPAPTDVQPRESAATAQSLQANGSSGVDIARGDRYRTDPLRAYREAGLTEIERLEIDPAVSLASVAASLGDVGTSTAARSKATVAPQQAASAATTLTSASEVHMPGIPAGQGQNYARKDARAAGSEKPQTGTGGLRAPATPGRGPDRGSAPIIILPSGQQPLVTMLNIRDFVEKGTFRSQEELRKQGIVQKPASPVEIYHRGQCYLFTDQPGQLQPNEWKRVVMVVCQGALWQFKGWPLPGDPAQLFARVQGVYFYYEDEEIPPTVRQWAVKCIPIRRHRRYTDEGVVREFWSLVEFACRRAQYVS